MNKQLYLSLALVSSAFMAQADDAEDLAKGGHVDYSGFTYQWVRPAFQSASPERVSEFYCRASDNECGRYGALQVVPFGGQSSKGKTGRSIGRYFTFNGKDELVVNSNSNDWSGGNTFGVSSTRDINPFHFGIEYTGADLAGFSSVIQFQPQQTVAGVGFNYRQYVGRNACCERKWWIDIAFPIEYVRNNMNLTESEPVTVGTPGDGPANMVEAFTGVKNGWLFGKIDGSQHKWGVGFIELKLGYDFWREECNCNHFNGYYGLILPTGNKAKGEYVFEPIVGNNQHFGFMTGGSFGYQFWNCGQRSLSWQMEWNSRYLVSNTQVRSFDLKNRPWSRYMLVYANLADATTILDPEKDPVLTPGINVFTRKVRVEPHFQHSLNSALVYNSCNFTAELGWNWWAKQNETVKLKDAWIPGPAVANLNNTNATTNQATSDPNVFIQQVNFLSNIGTNNNGVCDGGDDVLQPQRAYGNATVIQATDLNLQSAATPAQLTHTIYGNVGYNFNTCNYPTWVGLGGSYEFSARNNALSRWLVWGKFGVSI